MIRTSPQTTSRSRLTGLPEIRKRSKIRGFTLVEVLVVVSLIALISALVLPSITSYLQVSLNSATRDIATTVKEAYNAAVITGKVYRLAYDLKENNFWVEQGPAGTLLGTQESREREERRSKFSRSSDRDKKPKSEFTMDTTITRKKMALPRGVTFEDIVTQQAKEPVTEGMAYTHFFPHGLSEQCIIHLQDKSNHHSTLVITPLIGMTDLYDRNVPASEIFDKQ